MEILPWRCGQSKVGLKTPRDEGGLGHCSTPLPRTGVLQALQQSGWIDGSTSARELYIMAALRGLRTVVP